MGRSLAGGRAGSPVRGICAQSQPRGTAARGFKDDAACYAAGTAAETPALNATEHARDSLRGIYMPYKNIRICDTHALFHVTYPLMSNVVISVTHI